MERVLQKCLSARWLIAVIMTIVFAVLACTNRLTPEFITVYTIVLASYFSKDRADNKTNEG